MGQAGTGPRSRHQKRNAISLAKPHDALTGQWRVKCTVKTYERGTLLSSSQDNDPSLVVAETDSDGSYRLYKFPSGFGEALPRLRKVSERHFDGSDTVRGITTVVKQSVALENERVTITQETIDTPTNQTQSEITCTGNRVQSILELPANDSSIEGCYSSRGDGRLPDQKFARRYRSVKPFSDGLAAVALVPRGERGLKWGFIDETGRVVIPIAYDVATSFHDGLAVVGKSYGRGRNLKWGVVEKLGPQVTPNLHYDAVKILGEGFAAVGYISSAGKGLKWNLINRENTTILYGYDEIGCFVDGKASASYTDGVVIRRGYINKVGEFSGKEK